MKWVFDKKIAESFPTHARAHIPNYDEVIDQSIDVCKLYGNGASIIDVGVATGETISRLHQAGFNNLTGVDNSRDMLDKCPQGIARLIESDVFPEGEYDVALINWTLHFMQNKKQYLEHVFSCLHPNGALVLSEKTSTDEFPKKFYYDFKKAKGVSEEAIIKKENSLKSVMHINDVSWYLGALREIGFSKVYISNAFWCFTTFVCVKD